MSPVRISEEESSSMVESEATSEEPLMSSADIHEAVHILSSDNEENPHELEVEEHLCFH